MHGAYGIIYGMYKYGFVTYIWMNFAASVVDMPYMGDLGGTRETFGHVFLPLHFSKLGGFIVSGPAF
jgi:hypothetical protein